MRKKDQTQPERHSGSSGDGGDERCICRGNWRELVKEVTPKIGDKFRDQSGKSWTLTGLLHGDDDYYYCLTRKGRYELLSCVSSIENYGFLSQNSKKVSVHAIRGLAEEAIREATGEVDIAGKDGESVLDKIERLVLSAARRS